MSEQADASAVLFAAPPRVVIRRSAAQTRLSIRGREAARELASVALGVALPTQPCRAAINDGTKRTALWLGPDEWLVLAPAGERPELQMSLKAALDASPHALVDVSDRNTAFEVSGTWAAEIVGAECPLDLDAASFPVGACTRTLFAKSEIMLWRPSPEAFYIEVGRSFSPYVADRLQAVSRAILADN